LAEQHELVDLLGERHAREQRHVAGVGCDWYICATGLEGPGGERQGECEREFYSKRGGREHEYSGLIPAVRRRSPAKYVSNGVRQSPSAADATRGCLPTAQGQGGRARSG